MKQTKKKENVKQGLTIKQYLEKDDYETSLMVQVYEHTNELKTTSINFWKYMFSNFGNSIEVDGRQSFYSYKEKDKHKWNSGPKPKVYFIEDIWDLFDKERLA